MRIQGGGSRGFLPKSLNLYARNEYVDNRFRYDFWDTGYEPKRMTLSSGGDDYYSKIKDRLVSELTEGVEEEFSSYDSMVAFVMQNDMSDDKNYQKACEILDINSFIDYFAVQTCGLRFY